MKIDAQTIQVNRRRVLAQADAQRISEVSRIAAQYQRQHGLSRTEALRQAEQVVPHGVKV